MKIYHTPKDLLDSAQSEETPSEELDYILSKEYSFLKVAVAKNRNTSPITLKGLIPSIMESYRNQEIALAMAENPNVTNDILELLLHKIIPVLDNGRGHQIGFEAGIKVCNNSKLSIEPVMRAMQNSLVSMQFRKVLARETSRLDILNLLCCDKSEKVRKRAVENLSRFENNNK